MDIFLGILGAIALVVFWVFMAVLIYKDFQLTYINRAKWNKFLDLATKEMENK